MIPVIMWLFMFTRNIQPDGTYLFKVNSKNTRIMCEICSKLTRKTSEHVIEVNPVSLLLTLNRLHLFF